MISVYLFIITRFVAGEEEKKKRKRNVIDRSERQQKLLFNSLRFKGRKNDNSLRISSIDFKIVFDVELSLEREISTRFFFAS